MSLPEPDYPPISASVLTAATRAFEQLVADGDTLYWLELQPASGRSVVMSRGPDGHQRALTPEPFNVRSRVYEYGGQALATHGQTLYFVNGDDQRVYRQESGATPVPLTPSSARRYGGLELDRHRGRVLAICEDHTTSDLQPEVAIVAIPCAGGEPATLVAGNDFYMDPTPSPDGKQLAWLTWNHPNMPWNGCELWVAPVREDGSVGPTERVAGGPEESICHPSWSPDGMLHFISDVTGWWNLYRYEGSENRSVAPMEAEFGQPRYGMGHGSYTFVGPGEIVAAIVRDAVSRLVRVDTRSGAVTAIDTGFTGMRDPRTLADGVAFVGGSPHTPEAIYLLEPNGTISMVRASSQASLDDRFLGAPEAISFPTRDGSMAHAFYYAPLNPDGHVPGGERPPLLVHVHGGPNGHVSSVLRFGPYAVAAPVYWTSRGYAYLDVNYRGSTGYGRAYREYLDGRWGIVDVDDCIDGARFLVERGDVDRRRVAIRGGSAGGFTTLCALAFRDFFAAGTAYYGLSDLEAFHHHTHKYESYHDHHLIGPWPEERQRFHDRSAVHFADQITAPLLLLQGSEDRIVPPEQSRMIRDALLTRGVHVEYVEFEGEGHGFRRAESIQRSLETEEAFYARVFSIAGKADST